MTITEKHIEIILEQFAKIENIENYIGNSKYTKTCH